MGMPARFTQQHEATAAALSHSIVRWSKQICTSAYTQRNTTPNLFTPITRASLRHSLHQRHHDCQRQWRRNSIFGSMTFRAFVAYQFLQNDSGNKVISGSFEIRTGEKERLLYPQFIFAGSPR